MVLQDKKFSKYQGLGNDFIIINSMSNDQEIRNGSSFNNFVEEKCNRNFGIGADGLIINLPRINATTYRMRIFNSDGSEAEMCGNGIRCLLKYLYDENIIKQLTNIDVETKAGMIKACLDENSEISVDMGKPYLEPNSIPTKFSKSSNGLPEGEIHIEGQNLKAYAVGMGNPHLIIPINDFTTFPFERWGTLLENNKYFPAKTNVHFLNIIDRKTLEIKVWERGAGPTLACGTGACATAVASFLLGFSESQVIVNLPGGSLDINWPSINSSVFMKGPAFKVFEGIF